MDNDIYVRLQESSGFIESLHVSKWDQMGSDVWIGGMVICGGNARAPTMLLSEDLDKKLKSMIFPRRKKIADFTKLHSAK